MIIKFINIYPAIDLNLPASLINSFYIFSLEATSKYPLGSFPLGVTYLEKDSFFIDSSMS